MSAGRTSNDKRRTTAVVVTAVLLCVGCRASPPVVEAGNAAPVTPVEVAGPNFVEATFTSLRGTKSTFTVEVADTPPARAKGLMHRRELASDRGMVFVFPFDEDQTFYMKNTLIPLDMIFVGSNLVVVGVVEDARPLTLKTRSVGRPSRYVVELNAHAARSNGIGPGARVEFTPELKKPDR